MDRNKLTEEQASQRISSQLSNHQRVSRSNVVLSTLWEPHVTQKQVIATYNMSNSVSADIEVISKF